LDKVYSKVDKREGNFPKGASVFLIEVADTCLSKPDFKNRAIMRQMVLVTTLFLESALFAQ
jgi:hypothetical protein